MRETKCEECADLRRLLRKYGKHLSSCETQIAKKARWGDPEFNRWRGRPECTCGYVAAIADPELMAVAE